MHTSFKALALASLASAAAVPGDLSPRDPYEPASYPPRDVIKADVAVIGGGVSGTYGAIRLKDMGYKVVVVESEDHFGGHIATHKVGDAFIDFGVTAYYKIKPVLNFFSRFNITVGPHASGSAKPVYADFRSGNTVPGAGLSFDFSAFSKAISGLPPQQYGYNLATPPQADFLLPFYEFAAKYNISAKSAYTIANFLGGTGNVSNSLAAYVLSGFNQVYLDELEKGMSVGPVSNGQELYDKAQAELGSNALVSSRVIDASRDTGSRKSALVVQTPKGKKLIQASQVLVSIPLTVENTSPFRLDQRELGLFSQFTHTAYYCVLLNNTGLPSGFTWTNAGSDSLFNLPYLPAAYNIVPTEVPGYYYSWYGSETDMSQADVVKGIVSNMKKFAGAGANPTVVDFRSHTPFKLEVPKKSLSAGFYKQLYGLQGHRNTWYTGGTLIGSGAGPLWNYTETILPSIVSAIKENA